MVNNDFISLAPYSWLAKSLATIHRADWYRTVKAIAGLPGTIVELEGKKVINFASNDYLGLAGDERLIAAAVRATHTRRQSRRLCSCDQSWRISWLP